MWSSLISISVLFILFFTDIINIDLSTDKTCMLIISDALVQIISIFFEKFLDWFIYPFVSIFSPQEVDMIKFMKGHPQVHHKFRQIVDDVLHILKANNEIMERKIYLCQ